MGNFLSGAKARLIFPGGAWSAAWFLDFNIQPVSLSSVRREGTHDHAL